MTINDCNLVNTKNMIKQHSLFMQKRYKCIIEKIHGCKTNAENLSTIKLGERIPSGFSMFTISSFRRVKKHDVYRGKNCMNKFCEFLRQHIIKIINFKAKKLKLLTEQSRII